MGRFSIVAMMLSLICSSSTARPLQQVAPGAPGSDAHWPTAAKNGFGTANNVRSKVWFTLADGMMTEVFYPTLDVPNVQSLQFIVVKGNDIQTEADDTTHRLYVGDSKTLTFTQVNIAKNGAYSITKTYLTDPERSSVFIDVTFRWNQEGLCLCNLYVYYDPSLNNSGMHDSAWSDGAWLVASEADKASALTTIEYGLADAVNGYLGTSDGLTQLRRNQTVTAYPRAETGNVVQMARVRVPFGTARSTERFTLVLSFGRNSAEAVRNGQASVRQGFKTARVAYEQQWRFYTNSIPRVDPRFQKQFNMAAMVLKALEDKTHRGAMTASPSTPWGGGPNANEPTVSGYHAVWSRDLYHVATAFLAMGDRASANRALDYLFKVQQKPDGSFPQNSWIDGRPIGGGLQMDQVAFPLILAYQLNRTDRSTWLRHIKPAADFIVRRGPSTGQDRWEEKSGYSPSTIAAEIAGLVCAARIANLNGDALSARSYLTTADDWARRVERWTATANGPKSKGRYYLRITEDENPNDGSKIEINSGGGTYDEREIVDAGFLELVRLGVKSADDPLVLKSLAVVDESIKVETPVGTGWYRYNHDAYGERPDGQPYDGKTGEGRLWTLLTGERGEFELAAGQKARARKRLDTMMAFANDGMMIPEQVWDRDNSSGRFGSGTGSATPLAWSMAQFIRLALNLKAGRNLETPKIVANRYLGRSRK